MPIDLNAAKARLKAHMGREWVSSTRHSHHSSIVGPARIKPGDKLGLSREESVAISRLRTGHSLVLKAYRHRIGLEDTPNCPDCDDEAPEDLSHLMTSCPAKDVARRHIFGRHDPTLAETFRDVNLVLAYLRRLRRL